MFPMVRFACFVKAGLLQELRDRAWWFAVVGLIALVWQSTAPENLNFFTLCVLPAPQGERIADIVLMRGHFGSAWMALSLGYGFALLSTTVGFFIARGTVSRDLASEFWPLLATTPLSRLEYLLAKWLSLILMQTLLFTIGVMVAVFAQWVRGEDTHIHWEAFFVAYLWITLPAIAAATAIAIAFDVQWELRHTVGSIVYFVFWILVAVQLRQWFPYADTPATFAWVVDLSGFGTVQDVMHSASVQAGIPNFRTANFLIGGLYEGTPPTVFHFAELAAPEKTVHGRWFWVLFALGLLVWTSSRLARQAQRSALGPTIFDERSGARLEWLRRALAPLQRSQGGILAAAEILAMARTRSPWWWLSLAGLWVGQSVSTFTVPPTQVSAVALCTFGAWLLCLDFFCKAALRDFETGMHGMVYCTEAAVRTVLWARIAVLLSFAAIVVLPVVLRSSAVYPQVAMNVAALGICLPVFGLLSGLVTRSSRVAELGVLALAYATYEGAPHGNVVLMDPSIRNTYAAASVCAVLALPLVWDAFRRHVGPIPAK